MYICTSRKFEVRETTKQQFTIWTLIISLYHYTLFSIQRITSFYILYHIHFSTTRLHVRKYKQYEFTQGAAQR